MAQPVTNAYLMCCCAAPQINVLTQWCQYAGHIVDALGHDGAPYTSATSSESGTYDYSNVYDAYQDGVLVTVSEVIQETISAACDSSLEDVYWTSIHGASQNDVRLTIDYTIESTRTVEVQNTTPSLPAGSLEETEADYPGVHFAYLFREHEYFTHAGSPDVTETPTSYDAVWEDSYASTNGEVNWSGSCTATATWADVATLSGLSGRIMADAAQPVPWDTAAEPQIAIGNYDQYSFDAPITTTEVIQDIAYEGLGQAPFYRNGVLDEAEYVGNAQGIRYQRHRCLVEIEACGANEALVAWQYRDSTDGETWGAWSVTTHDRLPLEYNRTSGDTVWMRSAGFGEGPVPGDLTVPLVRQVRVLSIRPITLLPMTTVQASAGIDVEDGGLVITEANDESLP